MKPPLFLNYLCLAGVACTVGCASDSPPPRIVTIIEPQSPRPEVAQVFRYDQKPETNKTIFTAERTRHFISNFGSLYAGNGKPGPTFAIRVNPAADGSRTVPNTFSDQQATTDLIRYFGRPLREGGIKLLDEAASQSGKVDIVLNVLISWRTIQVQGFNSESVTKSVPDVQVTAVRQSDGAILGQSGTTDLIGQRQDSWVTVERVGFPELMRATALTLLEDLVALRFSEEVAEATAAKDALLAQLQLAQAAPDPTAPPHLVSAAGSPAPAQPNADQHPTPPTNAMSQIDLSRIALTDDVKLKEKATKLNEQIAQLNGKSHEIDLWKIALIADHSQNLNQGNTKQLVKNYVRRSYQPQ